MTTFFFPQLSVGISDLLFFSASFLYVFSATGFCLQKCRAKDCCEGLLAEFKNVFWGMGVVTACKLTDDIGLRFFSGLVSSQKRLTNSRQTRYSGVLKGSL